MQLKPADFDRMLKKYEENDYFRVDIRDTGDKYFDIYYVKEGPEKLVAYTKRSHGSKDMEGLIPKVRKQLYLSKREFEDLRLCPLKSDKIAEIYKNRKLL